MIPSEEWVFGNFDRFNKEFFQSKLPRPRFVINKARGQEGSFHFKRTRFGEIYNLTITLSVYYEKDDHAMKNVLLHEMIHYYITYCGIKDTGPHGVVFKKMMNDINAKGHEITVSTRHTAQTKAMFPMRSCVVMAVIGKTFGYGLSVVNPRVAYKIGRALAHNKDIEKVRFFISKDEFFRTFPTVRTPRAHKVTKEEFDRYAKEMDGPSLEELNKMIYE